MPEAGKHQPSVKLNVTLRPLVKKAALEYQAHTGEGPATLVNRLLAEFLERQGYYSPKKPPE